MFKNLLIYQVELKLTEETLQEALAKEAFVPCATYDVSKFGWNKIENNFYLWNNGDQIYLQAHKEEKIIPSSVLKDKLQEKIEELEAKENRKLKKIEKQALKDDIFASLLPQAFSKHKLTSLWIDLKNRYIYVDGSAKQAEDVLALLRKSLGSLPVKPVELKDVSASMTEWVKNGTPEWLEALDEVELREGESVINCKKQPLEDEVLFSIQSGKTVTKLALKTDGVSFVLCDDFSFKKIKLEGEAEKGESKIEKLSADFFLLTETITPLREKLMKVLS